MVRSPTIGIVSSNTAIDPAAKYEIELYDGTKKTVEGKELADWKVDLKEPRSFQLLIYKKL